mmetsp:Transcript_2371/g.6325  ORF Transcript_2371/g.6325 Transcript_2371/m.6325 type:complete len:111 (-) Transcript_2371:91-423(-)
MVVFPAPSRPRIRIEPADFRALELDEREPVVRAEWLDELSREITELLDSWRVVRILRSFMGRETGGACLSEGGGRKPRRVRGCVLKKSQALSVYGYGSRRSLTGPPADLR